MNFGFQWGFFSLVRGKKGGVVYRPMFGNEHFNISQKHIVPATNTYTHSPLEYAWIFYSNGNSGHNSVSLNASSSFIHFWEIHARFSFFTQPYRCLATFNSAFHIINAGWAVEHTEMTHLKSGNFDICHCASVPFLFFSLKGILYGEYDSFIFQSNLLPPDFVRDSIESWIVNEILC